MNCHHPRDCPYTNRAFANAVELWALIGRTPRSASLEPVISMSGGGSEERRSLQKARIARLFDNDKAVLGFVKTGRMSPAVCLNLRIGEVRYLEMIEAEGLYRLKRSDPVFRKEYKTFLKACNMAQVRLSLYEATRWLGKRGTAYKTWQRVLFRDSWKVRARK